mmetsp:Transcript_19030/g.55225  ORF Transcript_19030/g.55225 Transcript_19030/m.55225 type:complete len:279 (-) Transcript_19030:498-1334(-)
MSNKSVGQSTLLGPLGMSPLASQCGSTVASTPSLRFSEKMPSQSSISLSDTPLMSVMQSPMRSSGCPGLSSISSTTMPYHVGIASTPVLRSASTRNLTTRGAESSAVEGASKANPFCAFFLTSLAPALAWRASNRFLLSSASSGVAVASMLKDFSAASAPCMSWIGNSKALALLIAFSSLPISFPFEAAASSFAAAALAAAASAFAARSSRNACTSWSSFVSMSPPPDALASCTANSAAARLPASTASLARLSASSSASHRLRKRSAPGSSTNRTAAV